MVVRLAFMKFSIDFMHRVMLHVTNFLVRRVYKKIIISGELLKFNILILERRRFYSLNACCDFDVVIDRCCH